jgi:Protein of unknown function (DUF3489)
MAKSKTKPAPRKRPAKRLKQMAKRNRPGASGPRSGRTKHNRVLDLLRAKGGTTIAAMRKATGWQPHSVRGFLAGVVKKKLGLNLSSEKTSSGRVYRIVTATFPSENRSAPAAPAKEQSRA